MKIIKIVGTIIILFISLDISAQTLKAYYTNLGDNFDALEMDQEKIFGKYVDIAVKIKDKGKIEFSRITSYLPIWKTSSNEIKFEELIERKGDGPDERPDILSRYSHVRLISATDNKAIVHWRYFPRFDNVEWDGVVEEYFEIYADGKVTRSYKKGTKRILTGKITLINLRLNTS